MHARGDARNKASVDKVFAGVDDGEVQCFICSLGGTRDDPHTYGDGSIDVKRVVLVASVVYGASRASLQPAAANHRARPGPPPPAACSGSVPRMQTRTVSDALFNRRGASLHIPPHAPPVAPKCRP